MWCERLCAYLEDGGSLLPDVVHHGAARPQRVGQALAVHLDTRDAVVRALGGRGEEGLGAV